MFNRPQLATDAFYAEEGEAARTLRVLRLRGPDAVQLRAQAARDAQAAREAAARTNLQSSPTQRV